MTWVAVWVLAGVAVAAVHHWARHLVIKRAAEDQEIEEHVAWIRSMRLPEQR